FGIDMEILRIVERAEADDFVLREFMLAQREHIADGDILKPPGHDAASRRSTRLASRMVITASPFWLEMSKSRVTMPHWGWLDEGRNSAMVTVPPLVSPAMTGFFHFRFLKPSPPQAAMVDRNASTSARRLSAPVCQPLAA